MLTKPPEHIATDIRLESHPFYQGQGYRRVKTQQVYRKRLLLQSPEREAHTQPREIR